MTIINDWKAGGADVPAMNAAMANSGAFLLAPIIDFQGNTLPADGTKGVITLLTLSNGVYTVVVTSPETGLARFWSRSMRLMNSDTVQLNQ